MSAFEAAKADAAALLRSGDVRGAIAKYEAALRSAPDAAQRGAIHSNLSLCHLKADDLDKALEHGLAIATHRPDWEKAHFRVGEALFAKRDYAKASERYRSALSLKSDDAVMRHRLKLAEESAASRLYFRQLLPGRDVCLARDAAGDVVKQQIFGAAVSMRNFVYVIGDHATRECFVVDACWDVDGIRRVIENDKMTLAGAIATHYHFDHVGGTPPPPFDALGLKVPGLLEVSRLLPIAPEGSEANGTSSNTLPVYCHAEDAEAISRDTGVDFSKLRRITGPEGAVAIGSEKFVVARCLHTPGHSPGSMVLVVDGPAVAGSKWAPKPAGLCVSGDTIFPGSCGRLDLPDASAGRMFDSLARCARELSDDVVIYPGHAYNGESSTAAREKREGLLRPFTKTQWMAMHGK